MFYNNKNKKDNSKKIENEKKTKFLLSFAFLFFLILLLIKLFPVIKISFFKEVPKKQSFITNTQLEKSQKNQTSTTNSSNQTNQITFEGFLPCLDCDGILTQLTITFSSNALTCFLKEEYQNIQETENRNQLFEESVPCEIIEKQEEDEVKKILRINHQKEEDLREFLFLDGQALLEITPNQLIIEVDIEDETEVKKETSHILKKIIHNN